MAEDSKMRQLAEQFNKNLNTINQEAERDFINELIEVVTPPLKKVPEPVFREIFLPYFTGEKVPTKDNDVLAHWAGIVGSATDAAEVVNVKGEVLFEVPPLIDTSHLVISRKEDNGVNFGKIFEVYEDQARVHPNLGKNYLVEELSKKSATTLGGSQDTTGWVPVLKHYNLLPEEQKVVSQKNAPGDDDLVFGDD